MGLMLMFLIGLIVIIVSMYLSEKSLTIGLVGLLFGVGFICFGFYSVHHSKVELENAQLLVEEKMAYKAERKGSVCDADNCITINEKMYCDILDYGTTETITVPVDNYWKKGE